MAFSLTGMAILPPLIMTKSAMLVSLSPSLPREWGRVSTSLREFHVNGHGTSVAPKHKSDGASQFPHPIALPFTGEGVNESLRDFYGNV